MQYLIFEIWKYAPNRKIHTTLGRIAKTIGSTPNQLVENLIAHFGISETVLDRIPPPRIATTTSVDDVLRWLEIIAADRRHIVHSYGCGFEAVLKQRIGFHESLPEGCEVGGSVSLEGWHQTYPELNISTGYDGIQVEFRFCPECGVGFDTKTILTRPTPRA